MILGVDGSIMIADGKPRPCFHCFLEGFASLEGSHCFLTFADSCSAFVIIMISNPLLRTNDYKYALLLKIV